MSVFSYNGIILPYPFHENFSQDIVYDDVGDGTEKAYTRFNISLASIINSNYLAAMNIPGLNASEPATIMKAIRVALLQPRRTLSITVGGKNLIPSPVSGQTGIVDAKNGPRPQSCLITQLTNETFLIRYHIIAYYWDNPSIDGNGNITNNQGGSVLYNRWTEEVVIDDLMMSTRIREGKFVIRSDNPQGKIVDDLREVTAVVGVPKGFLRKSSAYKVSADGLAVSYRIEDKEVFKMPPKWKIGTGGSAYRAIGNYVESTQAGKGKDSKYVLNRIGAVDLVLYGAKTTPQEELIAAALSIGNHKLIVNSTGNTAGDTSAISGANNKNSRSIAQLLGCEVTVSMYENYVRVRMSALMKPRVLGQTLGRVAGQAGPRLKGWTYTPGSDEHNKTGGIQPPYKARGTAGLILNAAAYYDASIQGTELKGGQFGDGLLVGEAGTIRESGTKAEEGVGLGNQ